MERFPGLPFFPVLSFPTSEPLCEPEDCWQGSLGNVVCMASQAGEGWEIERAIESKEGKGQQGSYVISLFNVLQASFL